MHQAIDPLAQFNDRPDREEIIQKDEIISLKIDLNLLSVEEFIEKYCSSCTTGEPLLKIVYRKQ